MPRQKAMTADVIGRELQQHGVELRLHYAEGCGGPWWAYVVTKPLSRKPLAHAHGPTLERAATTAYYRWVNR